MSGHEAFEELCALAVTGDLEPDEFRRLGEHLYECATCRASYRDFHALVEHGGPALRPDRYARWSLPIFRAKKRFIARARQQGIPFEETAFRSSSSWRRLAATAVVILIILGLAGLARQWSRPEARTTDSIDQIALLTNKVAELERQLSEKREAAANPVPTEPVVLEREHRSDNELSHLRSNYEAALAAKAQLAENVSALSAQLEQLRGDSVAARAEAERLQRDLLDAQTRLSQANQELGSLRTARAANMATIAEQKVRLDDLAGTIREQTAVIQRDRELLAVAEKDIRDFMGARNLKIADVEDVGTPGKQRPLAGRIFYTPGRSFYFYAYDLDNKGNVTKVAFQAWGKREGRSQAPLSLGIFYIDDPAQKRWLLKFEDPRVMTQIDQVFVTVEPPGGSPRPTGKQLLFSTLSESANQP